MHPNNHSSSLSIWLSIWLAFGPVLLLTLTFAVPPLFAQCVVPPAGLVGWWNGNGNANDSFDTNNGTLMNGATFAPGEVGQAFHLDGVDDFVEIPNSPALNPSNQITVMAWWNSVSFGGGNDVIVQKAYISHSPPYYQYMLGVEGGGRAFNFYVASGVGSSGGIGRGANTGGGFWVPAQWYHLVGTYDGSTVKLYVNGTLRDSQPASGLLSDYGRAVRIGAHANVPSFTPGEIDEVALFNRALTSAEVASIYAAGSAGMCGFRILTPPENQVIPCGSNVTFSVVATNETGGFLSYQWQFNGTNIDGATNSTLTIANATTVQAGIYTVAVGNYSGSYLTASAALAFSFLELHMYAGVTIKGRVGGTYRVEYTDSFATPILWTALTNIVSLPVTPYVFIDLDSVANPRRFYRVVADACP
ncbi:MAG: hypothetical protein HOP33_06795 [Verrucomicrobia bacterium]|nr:hypothetical protein [Verrucomicrobiota bacterium]